MAALDGMFLTGTLTGVHRRMAAGSKAVNDWTGEVAVKLQETVVGHIQHQDLGWDPLKEKYRERKKREGFSEQVRIRTSESMIAVRVLPVGGGHFVGWVRGVRGKSGEDLVAINAVHEYGSNDETVPARPVIGPSVDEIQTWAKDVLEAKLQGAFR